MKEKLLKIKTDTETKVDAIAAKENPTEKEVDFLVEWVLDVCKEVEGGIREEDLDRMLIQSVLGKRVNWVSIRSHRRVNEYPLNSRNPKNEGKDPQDMD